MSFTWTPKLAVGVPLIDEQHQELFRRFAALRDAMAARRGRAHLLDTLTFLDTYAIEHFGAETAMMREASYPLLQAHLGAHAFFVSELQKIRLEIGEDEVEVRTVVRAAALLCDWLREHIASSDLDFAAFLAMGGSVRAPAGSSPSAPSAPETQSADDR